MPEGDRADDGRASGADYMREGIERTAYIRVYTLGETSKSMGCSPHIQQPAAANLYRKSDYEC